MLKRIFICLLAALLTAGLTSCGNSASETTSESADTAAPTETVAETEWLDSLGAKDFTGAEFVVGYGISTTIPILNPPADEMTGETMNDAMYQRDAELMERYNYKIVYNPDVTSAGIKNSVTAGDTVCDMFINSMMSDNIGMLASAGVTYNLMELDGLHLDREWWSRLMYENLQYNGKMFYTSGDIAPHSYMGPACVYLNLRLADDYAIDTDALYTNVYDGKWTYDMFYGMYEGLDVDLNGDGKMHCLDDFYGVVNEYNNLTSALLICSAGEKLIETDGDGKLYIDLGTDKMVDIITNMAKWFPKIENNGDNTLLYDQTYKSGRALFAVHYTESTLRRFRDMEDDYVILPMPKYTEGQSTYVSYLNPWVHGFICLPLVLEDAEKTAFLTDAMAYKSWEMVRPAMIDSTLKGKAARNEDCANMLDIVYSTTYLDFNGIYEFGGCMNPVNGAMFYEKPFASAYAAVEEKIAVAVEEFMAGFAD